MNTKTTLIVAGSFALAALPSTFAGEAGGKFKEMDADRDGRVTKEEYAAAAQAKFAKLDANSDGKVSAEELAGGRDKKPGILKFWKKDDRAPVPEVLSVFDQNADGQLTRTEHTLGIEKRFAALDSNQDGALTEAELGAGPGQKPAKDSKPAPQQVP